MPDRMKQQTEKTCYPVAIIGSGPVGLLTALALAPLYEQILLIGPVADRQDGRTSALMMPAIRQLEQLDIWQSLKSKTAPLCNLRIIDATQRLIRAPTVTFRASEIGEAAFGYNIPNQALNTQLRDKVKANANIIWQPCSVRHYQMTEDDITLTLEDGSCQHAALVIAADGRNSSARAAAGIKAYEWHYPQTALVLNFSHQESHQNSSHEFHTAQGPFTQVPLPGQRSSLVWVLAQEEANKMLSLGCGAMAAKIETHMCSMLGKVSIEEETQSWPPQTWPMRGAILSRFAAGRTILIGEAAHVFPPIGAQGLNLGLRDMADLLSILRHHCQNANAQNSNLVPVINEYNRRRRPDIWIRTGLVHVLNRMLLSNFLAPQILRSAGLEALRQLPPLRAWLMREGLAPGAGLKSALPPLPFFKSSDI